MSLFDARYFSQDGVTFMVIAAFCLGLITGALIMDRWGERPARASRPARVRPVEPTRPAARHRATPDEPMKGQGGASGGGHPVRIDVRA